MTRMPPLRTRYNDTFGCNVRGGGAGPVVNEGVGSYAEEVAGGGQHAEDDEDDVGEDVGEEAVGPVRQLVVGRRDLAVADAAGEENVAERAVVVWGG